MTIGLVKNILAKRFEIGRDHRTCLDKNVENTSFVVCDYSTKLRPVSVEVERQNRVICGRRDIGKGFLDVAAGLVGCGHLSGLLTRCV